MKHHLSRLNNGLRVLTVPMPTLKSATVTIWISVGSRYEDKKISGISHFLEHMAFKGSRKRPSARAVAEAVDAIGGEFNASTSKEWTKFYIRARSGNLDLAFDVLSDIVLHPLIKKEDIEREKGVIVEEIGMYEDTPIRRVWDIFDQVIFEGHPLGMDIAGTKKTVVGINRADFITFRALHYFAKNMMITVAGGVKEDEVLRLTKKYLGKLKRGKPGEASKFTDKQRKTKVRVLDKKIEQAHFILGYPGRQFGHKSRYADSVLNAILGGGMSSRLFTEVREKRGLAYAVRSELDRYKDVGYFATYAGVDPKKANKAISVILEQFYGIASGKLAPKKAEMNKAKEYVKGHMALTLEDTRAVSGFFGNEELMLGKVRTPEQVFKYIDKVTVSDVVMSAKELFKKDKVNLAIIGPYKSQEHFERLLA